MANCFKCGVDESNAVLLDGISSKGVVKVCRRCLITEDISIIRKSAVQQAEEKSVAERMAQISGNTGRSGSFLKPVRREDVVLKNMIETNFKKNMKEDVDLKNNLVENFHWIILRARRSKHMTLDQLAVTLREPKIALEALERGFVPEKSRDLITKIENYLFIRLRKPEAPMSRKPEKIDFNSIGNIRVSDFKEMEPINESDNPPELILDEDLEDSFERE